MAYILNPSDDLDIFILHFVCYTLLQKTVKWFVEGWNNHPVRTMNNRTPLQAFHIRYLEMLQEGGDHPELHQVKLFCFAL